MVDFMNCILQMCKYQMNNMYEVGCLKLLKWLNCDAYNNILFFTKIKQLMISLLFNILLSFGIKVTSSAFTSNFLK